MKPKYWQQTEQNSVNVQPNASLDVGWTTYGKGDSI